MNLSTCPRAASLLTPGLLALTLVIAAMLAGCGRDELRNRADTPMQTVVLPEPTALEPRLALELIERHPSGITGLLGIAIDDDDSVLLAGSSGIRVTDADGKELARWITPEPAQAVAPSPDTPSIWVAMSQSIAIYNREGEQTGGWGVPGRGTGKLLVVTDLRVYGANVLVADAGNRRIHRFDLVGDPITEIGVKDTETGNTGLICPSPFLGFDIDAQGVVCTPNPGELRVERYDLDGELLGRWGEAGFAPEQFAGCCNPIDVALFDDGRIVTAEKSPARVKVYDSEGALLTYLGGERFSEEASGLDVAIDSEGRIHVADPGSDEVLVFAFLKK